MTQPHALKGGPAGGPAGGPVGGATGSTALAGIVLLIGSVVLFAASDMVAKIMSRQLLVSELVWLRYIVFFSVGAAMAARGGVSSLATRHPRLQIVRGLCAVSSSMIFVFALRYLPLAEATAINFLSPAMLTAMSVLLLGERAGPGRWAAVVAGMVGVIIIIRPGSEALQLAALLPLGSATSWAVTLTITRRFGTAERPETTMFWTAGIGFALMCAVQPFTFVAPTLEQWALGFALGITATLAQLMVVHAYRRAPASLLAPFLYIQLVIATVIDYLRFGNLPDAMGFTGIAIIVASGLYSAHCERSAARRQAIAPTARSGA